MKGKLAWLAAACGLWLVHGSMASAQAAPAADAPKCGLSNGQKATGQPIVLGAIVSKTGPDDFSASAYSAAAYFDCVNNNGGINGRPVKFIIGDDKWNPETAAALGAKLVNDEKVLAMVASSSYVECGANGQLYIDNNVVAVSGVGVPRECFTARAIAPFNAGPRLSSVAVAQYMHQAYGAKSFVCIGPGIPNVGAWSCEGIEAWAKANGLRSKTLLTDPASSDATSTILQANMARPDAIVSLMPKGAMLPLLVAAEEQGLIGKVKFGTAASGYSLDVPAALGPAWDGKLVASMEFQPLDGDGPDAQAWRGIMDKYAAASVPRDTFAQAGFLAAKAVTDRLLGLDPAKLDRATVTDALRNINKFQSDMLCSDWYYGADAPRHNANNSSRVSIIAGKGWKVTSACAPVNDPELADLREYEKKIGVQR